MLAPLDRIYLMREDTRDIIDIDNLRDAIMLEMQTESGINDFIFMMSMVGNDFLPAVPSLKTKRESIDEMVSAYRNNGEQIIVNDVINWNAFKNVLKGLIKNEESMLIDLSKVKTKYPIEAFSVAFVKDKFDLSAFHLEWYISHLKPKGNSGYVNIVSKLTNSSLSPAMDESVKNMINQYLTGMAWVYTYYTTGLINYTYVYEYFFAPLLMDLIEGNIPKKVNYEYSDEIKLYHPFYQLMSVIPPSSANIMLKELASLFGPKSPIFDMFPTHVEVDLQGATYDSEGKTREWEGVVIVPPVDIDRIISAINGLSISQRKYEMFEPKENVITEKPLELQIAEREQRILIKSIVQNKKNRDKKEKEWDRNGWMAAHLLF